MVKLVNAVGFRILAIRSGIMTYKAERIYVLYLLILMDFNGSTFPSKFQGVTHTHTHTYVGFTNLLHEVSRLASSHFNSPKYPQQYMPAH